MNLRTKPDAPPPPVRCLRCGCVIMEAKPTTSMRAVCIKCLGMGWDRCPACGGERPHGVCPDCYVPPEE